VIAVSTPKRTPRAGFEPVRSGADHAGDEDDAEEDDRDGAERPAGGLLPEEGPGSQRDDDDLDVAEHRREAGADRGDRMVPQDEVGHEEDARDEREPEGTPGERAEAPALPPGEQRERRQRVGAAVERGRRRRDVGESHEDRREGDAGRARHRHQDRPGAHRRER
jgi:hypothetical protein